MADIIAQKIEENHKYVEDALSRIGMRSLYTDFLRDSGFFDAPASANHHGNYPGALASHSIAVANELIRYTKAGLIGWTDERSPLIVGLLHDMCKVDTYEEVMDDDDIPELHMVSAYGEEVMVPKYKYNKNVLYKGHGTASVLKVAPYINLTEEEVACIVYHMGAFTDKEDWEYYDRAVSHFPNVLYTHTADMAASQVLGI